MDRDRSRVLALFLAYLGLAVASLFILDWFVAMTPFGTMTIDMRTASVCAEGTCQSFSLGEMKGTGFYAPLGGLAFYGTILFTLLVGYQAVTRVITGFANESLSKLGYLGGLSLFATAGAAAFLFGPEATSVERELMSLEVTRASGPFVLLLAHVIGIAVLFYAVTQHSGDDVGAYKPIEPIPNRKLTPSGMEPLKKHASSPPAAALEKHESSPPAGIVKKHASSPPASALGTGPTATMPDHLKKKLKFVVLSAELTRAGIDARREDGSSKLVMWKDVVGLVARRAPSELDGLTFVDVVSSAGSTLRVLVWTRLSGETFEGEGDAWSRAVLNAMIVHCPSAALDPATKRFLDGGQAAQLADGAKLAAHDDKLS